MKKIILVSVLIWLFVPLPIFLHGRTGLYNTTTGLFWCADEISCRHEQAHYIDWHNGKISETEEFRKSVVIYIVADQDYSLIGYSMPEIYAWMYANGVPVGMEGFYPDNDLHFSCLPFFGGLICGKMQ